MLPKKEWKKDWIRVEALEKGWSSDRKYQVFTKSGEQLLLRLSAPEQIEAKKKEFGIIRKFAGAGFSLSQPLDLWQSGDGSVCMLLRWVEGEDLEAVLPGFSEEEQYRLGREAGGILKKIHSIPLEAQDVPAQSKKAKKLRQLDRYEASENLRIAGDEPILRFIRENIEQIWQERPAYLHGDFHPGNLICQPDGSIGVIDFNRWEAGDPYEEFYKLQSFGREISIPYSCGQLDAYFGDTVPEAFWRAQAVYVAHASLYSIKWAEPFGTAEIEGMVRRCRMAMEDYDGFRRLIPAWYTERFRRGSGVL